MPRLESAIRLRPALSTPEALEKVGQGVLCVVGEEEAHQIYGRSTTVAERAGHDRVHLVKWVRRLTNWHGRDASLVQWVIRLPRSCSRASPIATLPSSASRKAMRRSPPFLASQNSRCESPLMPTTSRSGGPSSVMSPARLRHLPAGARVPSALHQHWRGHALASSRPGGCSRRPHPSWARRRAFSPRRRTRHGGSARRRDQLDELVYDLANLDAGFRFSGEENRWGGRLAMICQSVYGVQSIPGYLENGVPPGYGWGASEVVQSIHKDPLTSIAGSRNPLDQATSTGSLSNGGAPCGASRIRPRWTGHAGRHCKHSRERFSTRPNRQLKQTCRHSNITKPNASNTHWPLEGAEEVISWRVRSGCPRFL